MKQTKSTLDGDRGIQMPQCHAFQRHFNKVHTRNCSLYKKAKMKGGLRWMTKDYRE